MPMQDPVIATDGYSYERSEFTRWIERKEVSPLTGAPIDRICLPNHGLRGTISELINNRLHAPQYYVVE